MKVLFAAPLALIASVGNAQAPTGQFPGCDLKAQHVLKGEMGGTITDPRQAHISMRANILTADLGNAVKAGRLTRASAERLDRRVAAVSAGADRYVRQKGMLSAGEAAAYDRALDSVAVRLCRR